MYGFAFSQTGFVLLSLATPLIGLAAVLLPPRFRVVRRSILAVLPILGVALAFSLFHRASFWLAGLGNADNWHLLFAGLAVVALAAPLVLRRLPVAFLCLPFGITHAGLVAWGAFVFPRDVQDGALKIAGDFPYCIAQDPKDENEGGGRYSLMRLAQSREDFSYLTYARTSYAYLLVEEHSLTTEPGFAPEIRIHHWQDESADFNENAAGPRDYRGMELGCAPRPDFLEREHSGDQRELLIYHPIWRGEDIAGFQRTLLRIDASFVPLSDGFGGNGLQIRAAISAFDPPSPVRLDDLALQTTAAKLYWGDDDLPRDMKAYATAEYSSMYIPAPEDGTQMSATPTGEHGLHVHKDNASDATWYARFRPSGEWVTAIECVYDECEHFFLPETPIPGFYGPISFRYPQEMLPDWRAMETALEARFREFVVAD